MPNRESVKRNGMEIQVQSPRSGFRYDAGLEYVLNEGYERYPNLSEMIGITIDVLNGTEDDCLVKMTETSYGWLNLAWEIKDAKLVAYVRPTGLRWQEPVDPVTKAISYKYWTPEFAYESRREFPLPTTYNQNSKKGLRHYLPEFNEDFIMFHLGISPKDLPHEMKKNDGIIIGLPPENFLVPVAYRRLWGLDSEHSIFGHIGCNGGVRGVRKISH